MPKFWKKSCNGKHITHFYFVLSCELSRFFLHVATKILAVIDNFFPLPFSQPRMQIQAIKKAGKAVKWIENVLEDINCKLFLETNWDILGT